MNSQGATEANNKDQSPLRGRSFSLPLLSELDADSEYVEALLSYSKEGEDYEEFQLMIGSSSQLYRSYRRQMSKRDKVNLPVRILDAIYVKACVVLLYAESRSANIPSMRPLFLFVMVKTTSNYVVELIRIFAWLIAFALWFQEILT
jgi:hypothetical protein